MLDLPGGCGAGDHRGCALRELSMRDGDDEHVPIPTHTDTRRGAARREGSGDAQSRHRAPATSAAPYATRTPKLRDALVSSPRAARRPPAALPMMRRRMRRRSSFYRLETSMMLKKWVMWPDGLTLGQAHIVMLAVTLAYYVIVLNEDAIEDFHITSGQRAPLALAFLFDWLVRVFLVAVTDGKIVRQELR
eukprot:gene36755-24703_t